MNPLVSIIIPCYNAERWVDHAIRSALDQTWARKEIIVVDDGSTDGSLPRIRTYEGKIKWQTGPNRGGSAARNTGLAMATGDYIQFLDADDVLSDPTKIQAQLTALCGHGPEAVATCGWFYLEQDGSVLPPVRQPYWRNYEEGSSLLTDIWMSSYTFLPHCWLCPAELLRRVGLWDNSLKADQDGDYFGRVLLRCGAVRFVDSVLVAYRCPGEGNVSRGCSTAVLDSRVRASLKITRELGELRQNERVLRAIRNRWFFVGGYQIAQHDLKMGMRAVSYGLEAGAGRADMTVGGRLFRLIYKVLGIRAAVVSRWLQCRLIGLCWKVARASK